MEIKPEIDGVTGVRGIVEEAHLEFFFKEASLNLKVNGEDYCFGAKSGAPTICVGQEVLLHMHNDGNPLNCSHIQIIKDDQCILMISKG